MTEEKGSSSPLAKAVMDRNYGRVAQLLVQGEAVDSTDHAGRSALWVAVASNNYPIANLLLDHGADIWFADDMGFAVVAFPYVSKNKLGSEDALEQARFIRRVREAGCPWPPYLPDVVEKMREEGKWPPRTQSPSPAQ